MTPNETLARVKEIAKTCGIADDNGMTVNLSKFKRHINLSAHKFWPASVGYKVYFGVPGWETIGLIEYFPPVTTRNKVKAIEMFWDDLKNTVNLNDLDAIDAEILRVRQKYSIGWL